MKSHTQQSKTSSQPSQPPHSRLIRRAPVPTSPLRTRSPLSKSQCDPNHLIRRGTAPISPPHTSPQQSDKPEEDEEELGNDESTLEDDQEELESLGQKRKQGCNLLQDALEEEVSRKKRKRGIVK